MIYKEHQVIFVEIDQWISSNLLGFEPEKVCPLYIIWWLGRVWNKKWKDHARFFQFLVQIKKDLWISSTMTSTYILLSFKTLFFVKNNIVAISYIYKAVAFLTSKKKEYRTNWNLVQTDKSEHTIRYHWTGNL